MAAILNSAILDSAILDKTLLSYSDSLKNTLPHSDSNSFILTQLDDGSHLEFCHLGFRHCHLGFKHLVIFSQIHSKTLFLTLTLTQTNSIWLTAMMAMPSWILPSWIQPFSKLWLKLVQSDSNSFSTWWWQPSWILPSWIQPCCTKLWLKLDQSDSNSFILTQLDDGSHLEFCHLGFRHCHLGFKHLVIFSQIHSKTLFLYSDFDSN